MRIVCDDRRVTVFAPAKINLFLEVVARRPDGFHEIETVMAAVDVHDTLSMEATEGNGLELSSRWLIADAKQQQQMGDVPTGSQNIVIRALELIRQRQGITRGAAIRLQKRIASAAGLGGASSDAAAALLAANHVWQARLSEQELVDLAAQLGSDIPFFLGAPVALCTGRGERIVPLGGLPSLDLVIVRPPEGLSTPAVYQQCRPSGAIARSSVELINAWRRGDLAEVGRQLTNRLQAPAEQLSPWIARLQAVFASQGCYGHQMSGSGSSYFGICKNRSHAMQVGNRVMAGGLGFVYVTRTIALSTNTQSIRAA